MDSVRVRDYMVSQPVTVTESVTIAEAARLITEKKVSGLVVVDTEQNAVGMLSELDCLRTLLSERYNGQVLGAQRVSAVMTQPVTCCSPDVDIISIAESMLKHKQRRRPVVQNDQLIGQITCRQLLGAMLNFG